MNKVKKAYTLIELIAVMGIVVILGAITIGLTYESIEDFMVNVENTIKEDKFDNGLLNIDVMCNSNGIVDIEHNVEFEIAIASDIPNENIVIIEKEDILSDKKKIKIIFLKGNKLMVRTLNYYDVYVSIGNNVILDEIISFNVNKKGRLIYYEIESEKAGARIRCI